MPMRPGRRTRLRIPYIARLRNTSGLPGLKPGGVRRAIPRVSRKRIGGSVTCQQSLYDCHVMDSGWLDEREARVWQAYRDVMRDLQSAFDRQLADDGGLSGAEFALLAPLSESPGGVLRTRDLRLMVGWDRSRTSHLVSRMQKRGLVVREDCADDARGSMVRLTPDGRAAIEAA